MKLIHGTLALTLIPAALYGLASVVGLGPIPYNPYGVSPVMWVTNGPTVLGKFGCIGDGTLINDVSCYPTPGRILTVSGRIEASSRDHFAIGADIHPSLLATANGQFLIGAWIDPQKDNNGASGFNCGDFRNCKTAGIVNVQSIEQRGYAMFKDDIVGLQNGSLAASGGHFEYKILGIGNVDGVSPKDCFHNYSSSLNGVNAQLLQCRPR